MALFVRSRLMWLVPALALCGPLAHAQEVEEDESEPAAAPADPSGPSIADADLAPYFTGNSKKARAALDAGQPKQALALLPGKPKDAPAHWLRAEALRLGHQCALAIRDYKIVASQSPPLRDRAYFNAGLCAVEQGDAEAAVRLLRGVSRASVDAGDAYLEAARQLRKLKPAREAAPLVEEVLVPLFASSVRGDPALAHLIAGDAFAAAGDKQRALAHFQTGWLDFPLSAASATSRERAQRLSPGAKADAGRQVRRLEMLVDGGQLKRAAAEASSLKLPSLCAGGCPGDRTPAGLLKAALALLAPNGLPSPHIPTPADVARGPVNAADPLSCRAKLAQGRAYRKLRQWSQAKTALAPVALRCEDRKVRATALFLLAQIVSLKNPLEGEPLWLALAGNFPESSLADDALFAAAEARRHAGDVEGARRLLERVVAEQESGDLAAESLFQLFRVELAKGHPRAGIKFLDQLEARKDGDGTDHEKARYWRARALLASSEGETAEAREAAQKAARDDLLWLARERPLTYHGLLARSRLAELAPEMETALETAEARRVQRLAKRAHRPLHLGALGKDGHLKSAIEYLRLGQPRDAARELSAIDRSPARSAGEAGHEVLTLIADLYTRAGDLRAAHNLVRTDLRSLLRHPASTLAVRAALLAYPLAFRAHIDQVATRASIPADLLQALMREESALDPRAVSPAGALGLTQLMPKTARGVARQLKLHGFGLSMLFEPAVNIRIGGTYLGQLYAHFKNPALALASYNAGPGNVGNWVRAHGELPLDAFVEEIPLDETKGYVKRCLRSFAAYRYLYGAGPSRVPHVGQTVAAN